MTEAKGGRRGLLNDPWLPTRWATVIVLTVAFALGGALGAFGAVAAVKWHDENRQAAAASTLPAHPPRWWTLMQQDKHRADYLSVYDCDAGQYPYLVPCPDYTATIVFAGDGKTTTPVLTPATNAKGEVMIGVKAEHQPEECTREYCGPEQWSVTVTFAESAQAYGYNELRDNKWTGPHLIVPRFKCTFESTEMPRTVEVYAGAAFDFVKSEPLTADRLGEN